MRRSASRSNRDRGTIPRSDRVGFTNVDAATRARMQAIRGQDTLPALLVRRLAHRIGFRFRLHRSDLPGRPDLTFPSRYKVVFVHGCFWHGHRYCRRARLPTKNASAWSVKIKANQARDRRVIKNLARLGWKSLVIWECEIPNTKALEKKLKRFLS